MTYAEIRDNLVNELETRGITDYAVRRDTGITISSLCRIKDGGGMRADTLVALAEYLGYDVMLIKKEPL